MRRSPAVVDRKAIAEHAWADETDPLGSNAIDVQMSRLRAKLPSAGDPDRHGPRSRLPAGRGMTDAVAPATSAATNVRRSSIRVALAATAVVAIVYLVVAIAVVVLVTRSLTDQIDQRITRVLRPAAARRRRAGRRTVRPAAAGPARRGAAPPLAGRVRRQRPDARPSNPALPAELAGVVGPDDGVRSAASTCGSPAGRSATTGWSSGSRSSRSYDTRSTVILAELLIAPILLAAVFFGAVAIGRRVAAPIERGPPPPARVHRRRVARAAHAARGHRGPHEPRARPAARRRLVPDRRSCGSTSSRSGCAGCSRTSSGWPGSTPRAGRRTRSRSTSR